MNILSFRMLLHMQINYDKHWIKIKSDKNSRRKKRKINSNIRILISLIIKIKITFSHKIKLKINKISNKINNRILIKILIKIHDETHDKALDMIEADQKNVSLVRNLNIVWKIISVLIMIIQIIQNMITSDHSILIKLFSKRIKSNFNLSESTFTNTWEHRLYMLVALAIIIIVIIVIIIFISLMNLNLTSKNHAKN